MDSRGHIDAATRERSRADGLTDSDLLEVVANVAAMTLTNYANNLIDTVNDFPAVDVALAA